MPRLSGKDSRGGKAILDGGMTMNGEWTMTLVGTHGTLRVRREDEVVIEDAVSHRTESFVGAPGSSYTAIWDCLLDDLVAWLDGGPEPMLGLSNMLKTSELNLAAYFSSLEGDRIDLPLAGDLAALDEWPIEVMARHIWENL